SFDLDDLLDQMKQIRKMGPLSQVLSMIPGVSGQIKDADAEQGEIQLNQIETIINSMTKKERAKPAIVNPSRKRRIAAGSGTRVEDINRLLRQFEQMQKMMKQMTAGGKKGKRMRGMMSGMGGMGGMGGF
ncbi:MAG: signal recognition particle protein, partial [Hydrogenoanaerobacterium sp.]